MSHLQSDQGVPLEPAGGGRAHDIRLLVRDDGVILKGSSRTHYVKQLALQAVMESTNLPVLANEIQVR